MKKLVLDASVVLKWFLPDEELGQRALNILLRGLLSDLFMAPRIWLWQKKDIDFITGDKRLHSAVKGTLEWVRWLGNM